MKYLFQKPIGVFFGVVLYVLQACATPVSADIDSNTPMPEMPQEPPIPVSNQVTLTSISFKEEGQSPNYSISAQTPKLAGSEDPRVDVFNTTLEKIVQNEITYFRENLLAQMPAIPISAGSFFETQYTLMLRSGDVWSLKFDFSGYADGAAHPYHYSTTLNYDLQQGREISFTNLFKPNTNPLDVIAKRCIAELSKRDIGFYSGFQQGAEPLPENYRNWNITPEGLLITFNEYQVAPYAAGQQTVLVRFNEVQDLIDPKGPAASLVR